MYENSTSCLVPLWKIPYISFASSKWCLTHIQTHISELYLKFLYNPLLKSFPEKGRKILELYIHHYKYYCQYQYSHHNCQYTGHTVC